MVGVRAAMVGLGVVFAGVAFAQGAKYQVVHSFQGSDGNLPAAPLFNFGGALYGTTQAGGNRTFGTLFSIEPGTGSEQAVFSFDQPQGNAPQAGLIDFRGTLVSTASAGADFDNCSFGCGIVFGFDPATGTEQTISTFRGNADGQDPVASLLQVGGTLYGTTSGGGDSKNCKGGCGTIFSVSPSGARKVVYRFQHSDGAYPDAALINVNNTLYGTTAEGGQNSNCGAEGCGTVFSFNPASGTENVVYSFLGGGDGQRPLASVTNIGGTLYGTTYSGGNAEFGFGTVFSLDLAAGVHKLVHVFESGADGNGPRASLLRVGKKLYGTTSYGGGNGCSGGCGTIFSVDLATSKERVLHSFQGNMDGAMPLAGLINVHGTLYGTTYYGGTGACSNDLPGPGCGTVFALSPYARNPHQAIRT